MGKSDQVFTSLLQTSQFSLQAASLFGPPQVTDPAADRPRITQSAVDYFARVGNFRSTIPRRQPRHTAVSSRRSEVDMKRRFTTAVLAAIIAAITPSLVGAVAFVSSGSEFRKGLMASRISVRPHRERPMASRISQGSGFSIRSRAALRPDRAPQVTFGNAGAGFKDGLPFQPWAAELQKKRAAEIGLNDPDGLCLPQGPLQYHIDPQPLKIAQMPRQILIIYESNYGLRTICMDGRSLPHSGTVQPYWHGYSVGRWEGDTLVVESNNFHGVDPNNPERRRVA